jgi:N-acetylmuramoyl-L-alanine amidase
MAATTPAIPKPTTPEATPIAAAPATGAINRTVIVLDPAHGGADNGARLSDSILEKDVDLAFAFKLRSLLQARGFTVVLTRDSDSPVQSNDPGAQLTLDTRAGLANHARAAACLLIHATGSGAGVHLYHSELTAAPGEATSLPWLTAQAAWVDQSAALAQKISQALTRGSIPLVSSAASVRPVDSLTCPALVLELAPKDSGDASTIIDSDYQQTVAEAISGALVFWKNQVQPPVKIQPAAAVDSTTGPQP